MSVKDIKYLDRGDVERLLQAAERVPEDWLLMALQFDLGCRSGELRLLRVQDMDMDKKFAHIGKNDSPEALKHARAKTGYRVSNLGLMVPAIVMGLQVHINRFQLNADELLFFDDYHSKRDRATPMTNEWHNRRVDKYAKAADLQKVKSIELNTSSNRYGVIECTYKFITSHVFRHSHIINALLGKTAFGKRVPPEIVMRQVGWSSLASATPYLQIAPVHVREGYGEKAN